MIDRSISRHFVTVDGRWGTRQVHYRRAGSGPLLLMLHQSPQSSRELEPLMSDWGSEFTVVAPDSPGYGLSDPLGIEKAELADFAAATIEFADAIGAQRFGVYGFHTGGMIGVAMAHGHADRVAAFACNGVAVPTEAELDNLLAEYLPRFEPRWDGGHLAWLWSRMREQTIFFPWHERSLATRMDFPMPSPAQLQAGLCEFLRAADHYHVGYRAAFVFQARQVVPQLTVPGLLTASALDPLQPHLDRLTDCPDCVRIVKSEMPDETFAACLAQLRAHPGSELPPPEPPRPIAGRLWRDILTSPSGPLAIRCADAGDATTLLVLHGPGGSGATLEKIIRPIAGRRPVIALDLPGHGESAPAEAVTTEQCAKAALAVLEHLELPVVDVLGVGGGACVALELAGRAGTHVGKVSLLQPPVIAENDVPRWREQGLPSLEADWGGGHLLRAWLMVRDGRLYFPWFARDRDSIVWQEPALDDRDIQFEVTEYLKSQGAWQALLAEQLDYPFESKIAACRCEITIFAQSESPWFAPARDIASRAGIGFVPLEDGSPGRGLARALAG